MECYFPVKNEVAQKTLQSTAGRFAFLSFLLTFISLGSVSPIQFLLAQLFSVWRRNVSILQRIGEQKVNQAQFEVGKDEERHQ